jgi:hypothetical protein
MIFSKEQLTMHVLDRPSRAMLELFNFQAVALPDRRFHRPINRRR